MGQQRLHQAIQTFGPDKVVVEWKPFVIDAGTDPQRETVEAYCQRRWGGSGWTHHLKSEGRKDGAQFQHWKIWPNTWKAHQLIQYCHERGISTSDRINQVLFRAEYEQGLNLSLVDTLVQLASTELGMANTEELQEYLMRDQGKNVVQAEIRSMSSQYGIRGVPYFIVRGQDPSQRPYGFSGAQSSRTLVELFQELADE